MNAVMAASRLAATFAVRTRWRRSPFGAACLVAAIFAAAVFVTILPAQAQQPPSSPERQVIVIGEGSVRVAPDYARIGSGATTRAKTAKEAADTNSKTMAAIMAMLRDAGIAPIDIQTSRFSLQPVYASQQPNTERKLTGFAVSNQVTVTIRQIDKAGDILDRLVTAGATDANSVEFLHSDMSKSLDQAREAAVADARRKAELYAHAAGLTVGSVNWITEDSGYTPPMMKASVRAFDGGSSPVPISAGEDTLQVRITVGFDMSH